MITWEQAAALKPTQRIHAAIDVSSSGRPPMILPVSYLVVSAGEGGVFTRSPSGYLNFHDRAHMEGEAASRGRTCLGLEDFYLTEFEAKIALDAAARAADPGALGAAPASEASIPDAPAAAGAPAKPSDGSATPAGFAAPDSEFWTAAMRPGVDMVRLDRWPLSRLIEKVVENGRDSDIGKFLFKQNHAPAQACLDAVRAGETFSHYNDKCGWIGVGPNRTAAMEAMTSARRQWSHRWLEN